MCILGFPTCWLDKSYRRQIKLQYQVSRICGGADPKRPRFLLHSAIFGSLCECQTGRSHPPKEGGAARA